MVLIGRFKEMYALKSDGSQIYPSQDWSPVAIASL